MTNSTLALRPAKAGYNANPFGPNKRTSYGAAGRYRRGFTGAAVNVAATWITDLEGFRYMRAFYRTRLSNGSLPFVVQLVFPQGGVTQHNAYVLGGFVLSSIIGSTFVVTASLEVEQTTRGYFK